MIDHDFVPCPPYQPVNWAVLVLKKGALQEMQTDVQVLEALVVEGVGEV